MTLAFDGANSKLLHVVSFVTVDAEDQGAYQELCNLETVVGGNGFVGGGNERNLERREEGLLGDVLFLLVLVLVLDLLIIFMDLQILV